MKVLNSNYSWFISVLLLLAVLFQVIWFLDKGVIFSDEAFFALQAIPNIEQLGYSYWHILYSPFILDSYLNTKYLLVIFTVVSAFFMGNATATYLKFPISPILIGIWCVIGSFILRSPTSISPNYTAINLIIFNFIIINLSLFLLYKKQIFLVLVGFFFASLSFVYITSIIFIIPLLLFLFFKNKTEFWKRVIWFGIGCILMFLIYFIFLQSPQEFISGILKAIDSLKYDRTHGSSGLIVWHKKHLLEIWIPLLLLIIFSTKIYHQFWFKIMFWIMSFLILFYTTYNGVTSQYSLFPTSGFYFIASIVVIQAFRCKISKNIYYILLLLTLPYFAVFGTDMNLFVKTTSYFPFILLSSFYLIFQLKLNIAKPLLIGFTATMMIAAITFFTYPYRDTWDGEYKPIEQNKEYEFKGATLQFDSERIRKLDEAKPFIEGEENVLVSHQKLWGYVLLLGAKPPILYYKFNDDYILQYIEENNISIQELMLLEHHKYPFEKEVLQKLKDDKFILKKIELTDFNIYTLESLNGF